jgi:hypothetical protein
MAYGYGDSDYGLYLYKGVPPVSDIPLSSNNVLAFLPNWAQAVQVQYLFETVIGQTRRFIEQRKAALPRPRRTLSFLVQESKETTRVEMFLREKHSDFFYVPVYSEPLVPVGAGSMVGLSTVTVPSTVNLYSLNNLTSFVVLIDIKDPTLREVIPLTTVGGTTLILANTVAGAFDFARTRIFPAMVAYIESKTFADNTAELAGYTIKCTEKY